MYANNLSRKDDETTVHTATAAALKSIRPYSHIRIRAFGTILLGLSSCTNLSDPMQICPIADHADAKSIVEYSSPHPPGTIIVDASSGIIHIVEKDGKALRYGRENEGFTMWQRWHPTVALSDH